MPGGHEVSEEIEHAVHENKGIALLIAVLALFLAFASAGGKGAQTEAISENVESANLWAFFQAKSIRATTLQTAAEMLETDLVADANPASKSAKEQKIKAWKQTVARYELSPSHTKAARNSRNAPSRLRNAAKHRWQNIITTRSPLRHWRLALCLRQRLLLPVWLSLLGSRADLALSGWDL